MAEVRSKQKQEDVASTSNIPPTNAAKVKAAVENNQLISQKEGYIRKKIGGVGLVMAIFALVFFPSFREKYGPMSMAFAVIVGVYRTGSQSL